MIYKNIAIRNFRGIKDLEIQDLARINVLLGKNNSGKSSILEGVFLVTGLNNPQLTQNIDLFRNLRHNEENDFSFIFYQLNYRNAPEIDAEFDVEGSFRKVKIFPKSSNQKRRDGSPIGSNNVGTSEIDSIGTSSFKDFYDGLEINSEIKKKHSQSKTVKSGVTLQRDLNGIIGFNFERDPSYKEDFTALYQSASVPFGDLYRRLQDLIVQKKKEDLINGLKVIDKNISDISLGLNNMIYMDIGIERLIPLNLMGDGVIKFITIVANLNKARNGVLLIDEIDNGLHFSILKQLWRLIFKLAVDNNVQLFITTHSKDTLKYLEEVIEEKGIKDDINLVSCYTISKDKENLISAFKYPNSSLKLALENDIEIRGEF